MHAILYTLLSYVPFDWIWRLNWIRVQFLTKWYYYFPNPAPKRLCQVCKETLQSRSGGSAADGFIEPSKDSGQEQFETYGQVTCPHHTSVQALRDSADEDCMICSPFWSSLGGDPNQRQKLLEDLDRGEDILTYLYLSQTSHVSGELGEKGGDSCLLVSVGVRERVFPDVPKPANFLLLPSALLGNFTLRPRLPSYSTSSFQSWVLARTWYSWCLGELQPQAS